MPSNTNGITKRIPILFFVLYLFVGLSVFDDYGISWDEDISRLNGLVNARYIEKSIGFPFYKPIEGIPDLHAHPDKDYGVLFELVLIAAEFFFGNPDPRFIFLLRHALIFLFLYGCAIAFYFLIHRFYPSRPVALIGVAMLVVCPRIFAHTFYNSKDAVFMGFTILNLLSMVWFLETRRWSAAVVHGLCSAATIAVRVTGLYLPVITLAFWALLAFARRKEGCSDRGAKTIGCAVLFVAVLICGTVLFWPYLWEDPLGNFMTAFANMKHFRWDRHVLFAGRFIRSYDLPWYYALVWMGITLPVAYSALFFLGLGKMGADLLRKPGALFTERRMVLKLLLIALFASPLAAILLLQAVLYDGWRHLYFLYPAFLLICCEGVMLITTRLQQAFSASRARLWQFPIGGGLLAILLAPSMGVLINDHPHQQVYFNFLAGSDRDRRFELDYWGLSYRQALEHIAAVDQSPTIPVAVANRPGIVNRVMLAPEDKSRIKIVPIANAKYFLSNFRYKSEWHRYRQREYPYINEIFAIRTSSGKILGIYQLRD